MVFCLSKEDEAVGVVRPLYSKCRKNIIFNRFDSKGKSKKLYYTYKTRMNKRKSAPSHDESGLIH